MSLFRRRRAEPPADSAAAIGRFWAWWSDEGAAMVAAAIADRAAEQMVDTLAERVGAISDGLSWELSPGRTSEHVLVVSAAGNPDLRAWARRWRMAAPVADATRE